MKLGVKKSLRIGNDLSMASDEFHWMEHERGLDLSLLDAEEEAETTQKTLEWAKEYLESIIEQGTKQREVVERWDHTKINTPNSNFHYEVNELHRLRKTYLSLQLLIIEAKETLARDEDIIMNEGTLPDEEEVFVSDVPTHWVQAKAFWERFYQKVVTTNLTRNQLIGVYFKVCKARQKKAINSWYYFHIAYHCAILLNMRQEAQKLLNYAEKCRKNPVPGSMWDPTPKEEPEELMDAMDHLDGYGDGVLHGSMSLDLDAAIDLRTYLGKIAKKNHCSLEEAYDIWEDIKASR